MQLRTAIEIVRTTTRLVFKDHTKKTRHISGSISKLVASTEKSFSDITRIIFST